MKDDKTSFLEALGIGLGAGAGCVVSILSSLFGLWVLFAILYACAGGGYS